jgi:hypothetical protein
MSVGEATPFFQAGFFPDSPAAVPAPASEIFSLCVYGRANKAAIPVFF